MPFKDDIIHTEVHCALADCRKYSDCLRFGKFGPEQHERLLLEDPCPQPCPVCPFIPLSPLIYKLVGISQCPGCYYNKPRRICSHPTPWICTNNSMMQKVRRGIKQGLQPTFVRPIKTIYVIVDERHDGSMQRGPSDTSSEEDLESLLPEERKFGETNKVDSHKTTIWRS